MSKLKTAARFLFAAFFIAAGVNHFVNPAFYVGIMPPYLPWHLALVYVSGVAEIVLGAMLCFRRWMAIAGWGLIALLIAVFPANMHMALNPEIYAPLSAVALWIRLPIQLLLIAWAWAYTRKN